MLAGADLRNKPLAARREMLRELISKLPETIRFSETFDASAAQLMAAVRSHGLEGVVAKRRNSLYRPLDRSGAWVRVCADRGQGRERALRLLPGRGCACRGGSATGALLRNPSQDRSGRESRTSGSRSRVAFGGKGPPRLTHSACTK